MKGKAKRTARQRLERNAKNIRGKKIKTYKNRLKDLEQIEEKSSDYKIPFEEIAEYLEKAFETNMPIFVEALYESCKLLRLGHDGATRRILVVATYADLGERSKINQIVAAHMESSGNSDGPIYMFCKNAIENINK